MLIQNKKIIKLIITSIFTSLVIVACNNTSDDISENKITNLASKEKLVDCQIVNHDAGETKVCGEPEKVVALSSHILDLLLSLGIQPAGYAVPIVFHQGDIYDNPPQQIPYLGTKVTSKPINLGRGIQPSLEKLTAIKPDLIVGETRNNDSYRLLSKIAPTLIWENRGNKGKWKQHLKQTAKALGKEEKAKEVIESYNKQIAAARDEFASVVANHPKLLLLATNQLQNDISVITSNSYLGEILQGIGFELVSLPASGDEKRQIPISLETLPQLDKADTIIVLGYNLGSDKQTQPAVEGEINQQVEIHQSLRAKTAWKENAIAQSLSASKQGRVYFTTFYRWNGLNGLIGTELVIEQLRDFLLSKNTTNEQ